MPVGTLKFKLPREEEEFRMAQKGFQYKIVIDDLDNVLRNKIKYEDPSLERRAAYSEIREELKVLMEAIRDDN